MRSTFVTDQEYFENGRPGQFQLLKSNAKEPLGPLDPSFASRAVPVRGVRFESDISLGAADAPVEP